MTAVAPPDAIPPAMPADMVICFPPATARDAESCCMLLLDGQVAFQAALRVGSPVVEITTGTLSRAITLDPRGYTRAIVIRLAPHVGIVTCQVGQRAPFPLPLGQSALDLAIVKATPGTTTERLVTSERPRPLLSRKLDGAGATPAGAVDQVSVAGIGGWVVDLHRPNMALEVELRCGEIVLARDVADGPRNPAAPLVDRAPLGRFLLSWDKVDIERLAACAALEPRAELTVEIPALGLALENVSRPISIASLLEYCGGGLESIALPEPVPAALPLPRVSVVVPNYNYARHLPERLQSLFSQGDGIEHLLIDDASTDDSIVVSLNAARDAGQSIQIITRASNSGAVLPQWRRASLLARGEYLLIAEADDVAEPGLIPALAAMLDADPEMSFAFADSMQIDEGGAVTRPDFKAYYAALGDRGLDRQQVFPAATFLRRFLLPRNLVVNVSAVLWRTAALRHVFARLGDTIHAHRATGDWRVYIEACLAGGSVGYSPAVLNRFRRHETSVMNRFEAADHLAEIETIHAFLQSLWPDDAAVASRLAAHRSTLRRLWSAPAAIDAAGGTP